MEQYCSLRSSVRVLEESSARQFFFFFFFSLVPSSSVRLYWHFGVDTAGVSWFLFVLFYYCLSLHYVIPLITAWVLLKHRMGHKQLPCYFDLSLTCGYSLHYWVTAASLRYCYGKRGIFSWLGSPQERPQLGIL